MSKPSIARRIVVSIDFGTSRSGYAFNIEGTKINIVNDWPLNVPKMYCKTLTQTLYRLPKGSERAKPVAFGFEAVQQLAEMDEDEAREYELVKFFKMKLHNNPSGLYVGTSGYQFQAIDLVIDYLKYMHGQIMKRLTEFMGSEPNTDDILWCLTIPAIWKEEEKALMKEAAYKAGIIPTKEPTEEQFMLILEPEGAAAYCLDAMSHMGNSMSDNDTFLILDCGGGTVDLTSHKIVNGRLAELTTGSGGPCGSSVIDNNFWKLLATVSSQEDIDNFRHNCPKGAAQIHTEWEQVKCKVKNLNTAINVDLSEEALMIVDVLGENCPMLQRRQGSWKIRLTANDVKTVFEPVINDIIDLVNDQLTAVHEAQGKPFDFLFVVGGLGGSVVVNEIVKQEFSPKIGRSIQSMLTPGEAIVAGAILLGLDPSLIVARKMRQTYGMDATVEFRNGVHDVSKRVTLSDKTGFYCKNYFDKLVEVKQTVDNIHAVTRTYKVQSAKQTRMAFALYTTIDPNPMYIDQQGVSKMGKLIIDMSDLTGGIARSVTVKTYFGKSDIKIEAVNSTNPSKKFQATFRFDTKVLEYTGLEDEEVAPTKYHVIFANDISGSMQESDATPSLSWLKQNHNNRVGALYESCLAFMDSRLSASPDDLASCVVYDHSAKEVFRTQKLGEKLIRDHLLKYNASGGTNFVDTMSRIGDILAANPSDYTPIALFMTDGEMNDDGAADVLQKIMNQYHDKTGFTLHTIVVGNGGGTSLMQRLATIGKGKMHRSAMSLSELKQVYASLAGVLEQR